MMRALTLLSVILISLLGSYALPNTDDMAQTTAADNPANGRRLLYSYGPGLAIRFLVSGKRTEPPARR